MKIRMHRGGLAESMETVTELKRWQDLEKFCEKYGININTIKCEHYSGPDERIGWEDTWIILGGFQNDTEIVPVAFSDGDVTELKYDLQLITSMTQCKPSTHVRKQKPNTTDCRSCSAKTETRSWETIYKEPINA